MLGVNGFAGAFPGNAGPFVSPPDAFSSFGADPTTTAPASASTAKAVTASPTAESSKVAAPPVPGPMPRVPVAAEEKSETWQKINRVGSWAGFVAGAYHGYLRNDSAGWAFGWALFGGAIWPLALPLMLAQGFGKPAFKTVAVANRKRLGRAQRNGFTVRTGDLVPYGRLGDIDADQAEKVAYRDTSGWDVEVRKFASRASMKEFLKKEARKSDYGAHGKRDWRALVKDVVGRNMVAYPSFQKES